MSSALTTTWQQSIDLGSRPAARLTITFGARFGERSVAAWSISVLYSRYPDQTVGKFELALDDQAPLDLEYSDGFSVKGAFSCHFEAPRGCLFETNQLAYGLPDKLEYLLGCAASIFDAEPSPLPPEPIEPPFVEPLVDPMDTGSSVFPALGREGDLFPYVYMRSWPEPEAETVARNFIAYPYPFEAPPTGSFLQQLAALRAGTGGTARQEMQKLAVSYIEGGTDPDSPFVRDPRELPEPVSAYSEVYRLVQRQRAQPPEQTLAEIFTLLGMTRDELFVYLESSSCAALRVRLFQSYYALLCELGFAASLRATLRRCLVVDHLLGALLAPGAPEPTAAMLAELGDASILLPSTLFPLPPAEPAPKGAGEPPSIVPYAIGDLHLVKQRLRRYVLGDLAYVESVMPGERRKSVRRRATRVTQTTARVESDEASRSNVARSGTLTSETSKALADVVTTTTYPSPGFSISYGPTTTLSGGWSAETKAAADGGKPSRSEATRFARDVVERAAARAAHRVVEARGETSQREVEEAIVSEHDNRSGSAGRRGIYRWLNEVHVAHVVRYGNRFVLEFVIPSPGAAYVRDEPTLAHSGFPPVPLAALGIASFTDVSAANFPELAARYPAAELELPPAPRQALSAFVRSGEPLSLSLPEGYEASSAAIGCVLAPGETGLTVGGVIGRTKVEFVATTTQVTRLELDHDSGSLPLLLQLSAAQGSSAPGSAPLALGAAQVAVEIEVSARETLLNAWRLRTFQALQRAYDGQLRVYEGGRVPDAVPERLELEPRPSYGAIERRELKRGATALLFQCAEERAGGGRGPSASGASDVARPRYFQFFEHAFEWRELSYLLLSPSERARRTPERSADARLIDFLEAEYAQLLVPVTPSEALRVLYFLASGMIWDGAHESAAVHEADLALASELKKLRDGVPEIVPVSAPWEVVVPTNIAVLESGDQKELLP